MFIIKNIARANILFIFLFLSYLCRYNIVLAYDITSVSSSMLYKLKQRGLYKDKCSPWLNRLRCVKVPYYGTDHKMHTGTIIVLAPIAKAVGEIFTELAEQKYPIEIIDPFYGVKPSKDGVIHTIDDYNSTVAYACRIVINSNSLSLHAMGLAIDINPLMNPYIVYNFNKKGETLFIPKDAKKYYVSHEEQISKMRHLVDVFEKHGLSIWGGRWDVPIDYMHFQVSRPMANLLLEMTPEDSAYLFNTHQKCNAYLLQNGIIDQKDDQCILDAMVIEAPDEYKDIKKVISWYLHDRDKFFIALNNLAAKCKKNAS